MICLISNAIQIRIEGAWTWNSNDDGVVIASQTIEPSGMRENDTYVRAGLPRKQFRISTKDASTVPASSVDIKRLYTKII